MTAYPTLPTPLSLRFTVAGVFDPIAATPALINGVGVPQTILMVSRAGKWNFATGLPDASLGVDVAAGDLVFYNDGTWAVIQTGARTASAQRILTIADDAVAQVAFGRSAGVAHFLVISDATLPAASFAFDAARPAVRKIYDSGTLFNAATGVLAGTTSTDTKVNVSSSGGNLYVENRSGATITLTLETGFETANGGFLPRTGALPMSGMLDTGGNAILLRNGTVRGDSDSARAAAIYLELQGGTFAARTNLIGLRGRLEGGPATPPSLLKHELAMDATAAMGLFPKVYVGLDNSGSSVAVLIGPERQVELRAVAQVIDGLKTFRQLQFGAAAQEMELPTARGFPGQALVQAPDGSVVWGGVELAANARIITLPGDDPLLVEFNATARTIGPQDLMFIRHGLTTYLWIGGAGTWGGVGNPEALAEDISPPVFTAGGVPYALEDEVTAGTEDAKAISPAVAASTIFLKAGPDQTISVVVRFTSDVTIDAAGSLTAEGDLTVVGRGTSALAPRDGPAGALDLINRGHLDTTLAGYAALPPGGKLVPTQMSFTRPVDIRNRWDPNNPGTVTPRNEAGGGAVVGGDPFYAGATMYVTVTGAWNFTTGQPDAAGTQLYAGNLVIFNGSINQWQIYDYRVGGTTGGGGGGGSGDYVPTSGGLMSGNLNLQGNKVLFSPGGGIKGSSPANPATLQNAVLDGGTY